MWSPLGHPVPQFPKPDQLCGLQSSACDLQSRSATVPQVCSALHQQYAEFGVEVVRAFAGAMAAAPRNDTSLARRRTALRVLAQLLLVGVSEEWSLLIEVMLPASLQGVFHFCRCTVPRVQLLLAGISNEWPLLVDVRLLEPCSMDGSGV